MYEYTGRGEIVLSETQSEILSVGTEKCVSGVTDKLL